MWERVRVLQRRGCRKRPVKMQGLGAGRRERQGGARWSQRSEGAARRRVGGGARVVEAH